MTDAEQQVAFNNILASLENGTLTLPALPDMAAKVLTLIDDPDSSADHIIQLVSGDPVLSAQLIKTANSATYAGKPQVKNLYNAVSRLGFRMLRNLVLNISLSKAFHSKNLAINNQMQAALARSREVAVISYVLAQQQKHLKPDQAMLAGLMHNIGTLPLCIFIEQNQPQMVDETLDKFINQFHRQLGAKLLRTWNFPNEFVEMIENHENMRRDSGNIMSDYTDIVTVAVMLKPSALIVTAWESITAVRKLGLTQEECRNFLSNYAGQLSSAKSMLGLN